MSEKKTEQKATPSTALAAAVASVNHPPRKKAVRLKDIPASAWGIKQTMKAVGQVDTVLDRVPDSELPGVVALAIQAMQARVSKIYERRAGAAADQIAAKRQVDINERLARLDATSPGPAAS